MIKKLAEVVTFAGKRVAFLINFGFGLLDMVNYNV